MVMTPVVRRPAVAGYYYPGDALRLRAAVDALTLVRGHPASALAVIVPHGSFTQCGRILGSTLSQVAIPRRCILLGPSHTGSWMRWSLMASGAYRTPLGDVPIDASCAMMLRERCPFLEPDAWTQRGEHAVEAVLPFLQRLGPADLTVVPIIMGAEDPSEEAQLAHALGQVVRMQEEAVLLIASSDLSHYAPREHVEICDAALIDAICELDAVRLAEHVERHSVVMCGCGAVRCVLSAAKALGAAHGRLVQYGTSADTGGDPHSAIGYAGIVIRSNGRTGQEAG